MWKSVVVIVILKVILWEQCGAISALCPPDRNIVPLSQDNEADSFCDCHMAHSTPWGLPTVTIDCQGREIQDDDLPVNLTLPFATEDISLAWNNLTMPPTLATAEHLRILTLSHNTISNIDSSTPFIHLLNLRRLDLSFNQLATLSDDAFDGLKHLQHLDLSHNHLTTLPSNVFANLPRLNHLLLSANPLANFLSQENLFSYTGISKELKNLEVANCSLTKIHLDEEWTLSRLILRENLFSGVPDIPATVQVLDFGGNFLKHIDQDTFPPLTILEELYLDNMIPLKTILENAFVSISGKLRILSLEGCRNMTTLDTFAFGNGTILRDGEEEQVLPLNLQMVNLRGCRLKRISPKFLERAENLTKVFLAGNPLICDCDCEWIHSLKHETGAQCSLPVILRGTRVSALEMEQFNCDTMRSSVYTILNGLIVFALLCACGVAIYLIVMKMKPSRRHVVQKLALTSPYARVTIQPNRAEHL
ncbi:Leucine-rich repeat [Sergentomyia squamirostris]